MTASMTQTWQRERAWLGYAGLAPFVGGVIAIALAPDGSAQSLAVDLLRYYAAVIASFLGAVHWGAAAQSDNGLREARLRWGVMPALLAWSLLLVPAVAAFVGFAALFALILFVDCRYLPLLDDAYRRLRVRLSLVVIATLALAALLAPAAAG